MQNRKCLNCGGNLKKGTYICEYCGTDWSPAESIEPGASIPTIEQTVPSNTNVPKPPVTPAPQAKAWHSILFFFLLFFCGPIALIFMWAGIPWGKKAKIIITLVVLSPLMAILPYGYFYETTYAIRMDTPKYNAEAPKVSERKIEAIEAKTIYQDLRDAGDRSLSDRKQIWLEKYEGRWVTWKGEILSVNIYETSGSEINMKIKSADPFKIEVNFDPLLNETLQPFSPGDSVTVSGQLWGYYFLSDSIRLADGAVIGKKK